MNLWLAAFVALLCALAGVALGLWFSRLRSPYWMIGYFIPIVLILIFAVAYHVPALLFTPPVSWMMLGLKKFAVFGFITTMVLTTPVSRLQRPRDRRLIFLLMTAMVFFIAIWPFLAPAFDRFQLAHLQTKVDDNGVCEQTTDYTCGPAAAVTALRKLGLPAEEGKIAILSCTSNQEGTPTDLLADALQKEYGKDGLTAKCRVFKNISELKQAGLTLAVIKYGFMVDHWVTVLEVTDSEVVIGDPLGGLRRLSYDSFLKQWRFIGIVLQRKT
jgi:predicted double-glycine peptidase